MLQGKKHVLLISHRPTALVETLAHTLAASGAARVTLALRHTQDGRLLVKRITQRLPQKDQPGSSSDATQQHLYRNINPDDMPASIASSADINTSTSSILSSSNVPLNFARLASVAEWAESINASDEPLDLLVIDTWDLYAAGIKDRRWYSPQGVAGTAQTGFIGPAVLLHLLRPKLAACGTAVLLTASPSHRLAALTDIHSNLTSWGQSTAATTQAALLAYVRRLAIQLHSQGVKAAAVDLGVQSEQPLKGSLLRKLPVLRQALHTLLPSAHDAAHLLADVAAHLLQDSGQAQLDDTAGGEQLEAGGAAGALREPPAAAGQNASTDLADAVSTQTPETVSAQAAAPEVNAPGLQQTTDSKLGDAVTAAPAGPLLQANYLPEDSSSSSSAQHTEATADDVFGADDQSSAAYDVGFGVGRMAKLPAAATGVVQSALQGATATAGAAAGALYSAAGTGANVVQAAAGTGTGVIRAVADTGAGVMRAVAGSTGNLAAAAGLGAVGGAEDVGGGNFKPFSYISRGLLASPLLTALDLSGSSTFTSRTLHALTAPLYDLASLSLITAASLADYPVRALVLRPVGLLPSLVSRMGPLGAWAGQLTLQLQRLVPGVVDAGDGHGVPPQGWVEVLPSGAVLDDKTGWRMWHLVDGNAARATAA